MTFSWLGVTTGAFRNAVLTSIDPMSNCPRAARRRRLRTPSALIPEANVSSRSLAATLWKFPQATTLALSRPCGAFTVNKARPGINSICCVASAARLRNSSSDNGFTTSVFATRESYSSCMAGRHLWISFLTRPAGTDLVCSTTSASVATGSDILRLRIAYLCSMLRSPFPTEHTAHLALDDHSPALQYR